MSDSREPALRRILVVSHIARDEAIEAAIHVVRELDNAGVQPVLELATLEQLREAGTGELPTDIACLGEDAQPSDLELAVVLGGDGTILRAAELVRGSGVPIIGVNLGHVGFLAETERDSIPALLEQILDRDYEVEERLALDVIVQRPGDAPMRTWALNDAAVEKANRERMIEVAIGVDGDPLSSFGCDGVLISTPTGSTAYSFSAGGPVVWPEVEALVLVPISAHALFARPLVTSPSATLTVDLMEHSQGQGVLSCDGRRSIDLAPGSRVVIRKSPEPVRLARLHESRFAKRLVEKFELPIHGWRGKADVK